MRHALSKKILSLFLTFTFLTPNLLVSPSVLAQTKKAPALKADPNSAPKKTTTISAKDLPTKATDSKGSGDIKTSAQNKPKVTDIKSTQTPTSVPTNLGLRAPNHGTIVDPQRTPATNPVNNPNLDYCYEAYRVMRSHYTRDLMYPPLIPSSDCQAMSREAMDIPAILWSACENYVQATSKEELDNWLHDLQKILTPMTCLDQNQYMIADGAIENGMHYLFAAFPNPKAIKAMQGLINASILFADGNPRTSPQLRSWRTHLLKLPSMNGNYLPDGIWFWRFFYNLNETIDPANNGILEFYSFETRKTWNFLEAQAKAKTLSKTQQGPANIAIAKNKSSTGASKEVQIPVISNSKTQTANKTKGTGTKVEIAGTSIASKISKAGSTPPPPTTPQWLSGPKLPENIEELIKLYLGDTTGGEGCASLGAALMTTGTCCGGIDCSKSENRNSACCSLPNLRGKGNAGPSPMTERLLAMGRPDLACTPQIQRDSPLGPQISLDKWERICTPKNTIIPGPSVGGGFGTNQIVVQGSGNCEGEGINPTAVSDMGRPPEPKKEKKDKGDKPSTPDKPEKPKSEKPKSEKPKPDKPKEPKKEPEKPKAEPITSNTPEPSAPAPKEPEPAGGEGRRRPFDTSGTEPENEPSNNGGGTGGNGSGGNNGGEREPIDRFPGDPGEREQGSGSTGGSGRNSTSDSNGTKIKCPDSGAGGTGGGGSEYQNPESNNGPVGRSSTTQGGFDFNSPTQIANYIFSNDPEIRSYLESLCQGPNCSHQDIDQVLEQALALEPGEFEEEEEVVEEVEIPDALLNGIYQVDPHKEATVCGTPCTTNAPRYCPQIFNPSTSRRGFISRFLHHITFENGLPDLICSDAWAKVKGAGIQANIDFIRQSINNSRIGLANAEQHYRTLHSIPSTVPLPEGAPITELLAHAQEALNVLEASINNTPGDPNNILIEEKSVGEMLLEIAKSFDPNYDRPEDVNTALTPAGTYGDKKLTVGDDHVRDIDTYNHESAHHVYASKHPYRKNEENTTRQDSQVLRDETAAYVAEGLAVTGLAPASPHVAKLLGEVFKAKKPEDWEKIFAASKKGPLKEYDHLDDVDVSAMTPGLAPDPNTPSGPAGKKPRNDPETRRKTQAAIQQLIARARAILRNQNGRGPANTPTRNPDQIAKNSLNRFASDCGPKNKIPGGIGGGGGSQHGTGDQTACTQNNIKSFIEGLKHQQIDCEGIAESQRLLAQVRARQSGFTNPPNPPAPSSNSPAPSGASSSSEGGFSETRPLDGGEEGLGDCDTMSYQRPGGSLGGLGGGDCFDPAGCGNPERILPQNMCGHVDCAPGQLPDSNCRCSGPRDMNIERSSLPTERTHPQLERGMDRNTVNSRRNPEGLRNATERGGNGGGSGAVRATTTPQPTQTTGTNNRPTQESRKNTRNGNNIENLIRGTTQQSGTTQQQNSNSNQSGFENSNSGGRSTNSRP